MSSNMNTNAHHIKMQCNITLRNLLGAPKDMSVRLAYSPALYQIKSAIAILLVSLRCQVKIWENQAEETALSYGCNLWWERTCGGTGGAEVESG